MTSVNISTEHIWKLLSARLRSFFQRRIDDQQLSEDLLQETFVRIHKGVQSLNDEERILSWVFRIARNVLVDHFRRIKPHEGLINELNDQTEVVEGRNRNEEIAACLPRMLDTLPEKYREAVSLFELSQVPQQEIANRLGVSLSGAKSRIQRGREKLKEALLHCCHFEFDRRGNVIRYRQSSPACHCCAENSPTDTCP